MSTEKENAAAGMASRAKGTEFHLRLLAFGALASNALYKDIVNNGSPAQIGAANEYFTNTKPEEFVPTAKAYLEALTFPEEFVTSSTDIPWALINQSGLKSMQAIIEADSDDYDDGGCVKAITDAIVAILQIHP
jgi:hypothetical protein